MCFFLNIKIFPKQFCFKKKTLTFILKISPPNRSILTMFSLRKKHNIVESYTVGGVVFFSKSWKCYSIYDKCTAHSPTDKFEGWSPTDFFGDWETLKHANLIDFRGNCQVFIKESICKTLFLNFLKKVRIFMYLCFLQNLTNSTKKFTFFKFEQKVIILMKIGSAQCFHFWKSSKLTEYLNISIRRQLVIVSL